MSIYIRAQDDADGNAVSLTPIWMTRRADLVALLALTKNEVCGIK